MHDYGDIRLALNGAHQVANAVVAVRALEAFAAQGHAVPADAVIRGLAAVTWPGRLDRRILPDGRELILDAAHNPAGAAALAAYLEQLDGRRPALVFAVMRDKDVRGMLRVLLPIVDTVIVTRASNQRSADPEALAHEVRAVAPDTAVHVARSSSDALAMAWHASSRVVVAGSIFLLADVLAEMEA
jgi:dihydrofolate synthase / folylpolyglutamate synthase